MITVQNLSLRLGGRQILRDVSFTVRKGDFLAIVGPNGGGKSSLIKCLVGLIEPSGGNILRDAIDARDVGYVPQIKTLDRTFPARSIDLVVTAMRGSWPARISPREMNTSLDALERVGADKLAFESLGSLSGGELQRVYLARAIIRKPSLLLLDEPEAGIDVFGTSDLYSLLDEYRAETDVAVVMVTHDWEVAFHHASSVLLLNGDQISFGPPNEALNETAIRNAFGHVGHKHGMLSGGQVRD